jgi:eukaryotic-like serine/threonine-protein kinase
MIGQTLGHYRIVAKIGTGGMGEVYRAHDEQLDRDVALKVLPTGALADEGARRQFRKEALALAKLNHPNIETVYEFSSQDGVDFLAMELIAGSPLSEKLKSGPLLEKEILRLGMQFAQGLAAAHEQGIVHRDLKPGNLMITPDGRLKILDFGLAQLVHRAADRDMTRSITQETPTVSGTVPYMAPEQLRGERVDTRSDIYAAGAVLYDMATGKHAFPETQTTRLIDAILHDLPPSPRSVNPRISSGLQVIIQKAMEKQPAARYQSARELLVALEGLGTGIAPNRRARPLVIAGAGALSIVLLVGLVIGLNLGGLREWLVHRSSAENSGPIYARRSVAVLGFKNLSGRQDEAWLSTALSEMLTTELAAGEKLRTVPGENVAQMKISLSLPDADGYGKETLAKIRKNLAADDVVLGSYLALGAQSGGSVRLDLRLQDAAAGETIAAVSEDGSEAQLSDLISRSGKKLREKLGAGEVSGADADAVKASLPANPEAARLYSEGLKKLRTFDNVAARDLLVKSVATEQNFALAHSALASAWRGLGYDQESKHEAKKAFDLSKNLPEEDRLFIEARYDAMIDEDEKSAELYRTLWSLYPDDIEYGYRLGSEQVYAGKPKDALVTVQSLRKLPAPSDDDPRIDLLEAAAASKLADFKLEQAVAAKAVIKADSLGARLVRAQALDQEGWALEMQGNHAQALPLFRESEHLYSAAGNRAGAAGEMIDMALVLADEHDTAGARKLYEESLDISRAVGDRYRIAAALSNLGILLAEEGDWKEAIKKYQEAILVKREMNDKHSLALTLNNMGIALEEGGKLTEAQEWFEKARVSFDEIGDKMMQATARDNIANVLETRGQLAEAKDMHQQAATIHHEIGSKPREARALDGVGRILFDQGDLAGAEAAFKEAFTLRQQNGEKDTDSLILLAVISETWGNLAEAEKSLRDVLSIAAAEHDEPTIASAKQQLADVLNESERPKDAEPLAREAMAEWVREKDTDDEADAGTVLAVALLKQNKVVAASKALARAQTIAAKTESMPVRLDVVEASARVRAELGEESEAEATLNAALNEATKHGFVSYESEERLALGEIQMKSGKAVAGRAHLAELEKDATAKGFVLIARKAHAAAAR